MPVRAEDGAQLPARRVDPTRTSRVRRDGGHITPREHAEDLPNGLRRSSKNVYHQIMKAGRREGGRNHEDHWCFIQGLESQGPRHDVRPEAEGLAKNLNVPHSTFIYDFLHGRFATGAISISTSCGICLASAASNSQAGESLRQMQCLARIHECRYEIAVSRFAIGREISSASSSKRSGTCSRMRRTVCLRSRQYQSEYRSPGVLGWPRLQNRRAREAALAFTSEPANLHP
jgi:hypothetical protein